MATILALLLLCAGAALVLFGVAQRQDKEEVSDDLGEYLRSLDRGSWSAPGSWVPAWSAAAPGS